MAEEQSYDEDGLTELEDRLKTEKFAVKAKKAKHKMFMEAIGRAFSDDLSAFSSRKVHSIKMPNNIAEVLPELEPSKVFKRMSVSFSRFLLMFYYAYYALVYQNIINALLCSSVPPSAIQYY